MKSKALFLLLFLACCMSGFSQEKQAPSLRANTSQIRYVGRTISNDFGEVTFDWVGTYFEFDFQGESLAMRASDSGESHFNVFVDNQWHKTIVIHSKDTVINILSDVNEEDWHHVRVQKRSEGEFGCTTIHGFTHSKKAALGEPLPRRARFIEFIGDSYTVGYGADGSSRDEPFSVATENAEKTYACVLTRYFQADYALVAHSGRGAARNYGDTVSSSRYTMKDLMLNSLNSDTTTHYHFDQYTPDLVVIHLGLNDFSTSPVPSESTFEAAYLRIIRQLRDAYGSEVKILCVIPRLNEPFVHYISKIVAESQDNNLHHTASLNGVINDDSDMRAGWHPGVLGHQKMATFLVPYVATIMNWSLEDRIIQ